MHCRLFLFALRDNGDSTIAFRYKGAVSWFCVHRRGDGDSSDVRDVCRHKEKALMWSLVKEGVSCSDVWQCLWSWGRGRSVIDETLGLPVEVGPPLTVVFAFTHNSSASA